MTLRFQKSSPRLLCAASFALASVLSSSAFGYAGRLIAQRDCPVEEPTGMTSDGQSLWLSDMATRTLVKVRPSDGTVADKLEAQGDRPTGLAFHAGVLYAADRDMDSIGRRKLEAGPDLSPVPYYGQWAGGMAHDGTHLWVVDQRAAKLHKLDPADGTTISSFDAPAKAPTGLAFDGRYLWVADHGTDELYMVDPRDGKVIFSVSAPGPYPSALAVVGSVLWVADYQTRQLYEVALPDGTPFIEDQPRRARVSYETTYRAQGNGRIVNLVGHLALPRDLPGQHLLAELQFEPAPQRIETDRWGQKVAIFELGALQSGQVARISWRGDFALYRTRFQLVPELMGEPSGIDADLAPYLKDDRKYDLESPVIAELVEKLSRDKKGAYERARAIYEHLTRSITYERSGGWNNAAAVLARGSGSCSEYTFALVALLRKAGIPARYVGAVSERGDQASYDDVFHRWAEAWFPGYGWIPIDANAGWGALPGERGLYFGGRSNRHVVTTIAGGESELLDWTYNDHQSYGVEGAATLTTSSLARFRPLDSGREVKSPEAQQVLAPLPSKGPRSSGGLGWGWLSLGAATLSLGLGVGVGMMLRVRRPQ